MQMRRDKLDCNKVTWVGMERHDFGRERVIVSVFCIERREEEEVRDELLVRCLTNLAGTTIQGKINR